MSETSDTKLTREEASEFALNILRENREAIQAERDEHFAALNQPAPCGPGLTEEERDAIEESIKIVDGETRNYMTAPGDINYMREICKTLNNLLTRAAKADTVTLRREVVGSLLSLFRDTVYMLSKIDVDMGEDWEDRREQTIAEAEAALAKGGEHVQP